MAAFPGINGKIAFESNRDGNIEIYLMNGDGSSQTNLTNNASDDDDPAFSPDGRQIAFVSTRDGNREIYLMDADGSKLTNLTNNSSDDIQPAFSPDGMKIAFASNRSGNREVYVMNTDGSEPIRLTNNPAIDRAPAYSPDGTKITFRSNRDGNDEIYLMGADGSNAINLTNNPAMDFAPNFSPDGTKIVFASTRDGNDEVYMMNADGTNQTNMTNSKLGDNYPAFSPDGTRIAFRSNRDSNFEIYVMNTDGSNPVNLTKNPAPDLDPDWGLVESSSTNTPPTLDTGPDLFATEGAEIMLSAKFTDPDPDDVHTATVDWGDGSPVQAGTLDEANDTVSASHSYANDGFYTMAVTIFDGRGGIGRDTATVTVSNVSPDGSAGGPYSGYEGVVVTMNGNASDPGADVLTFEWDFDYDGASFQAEAFGSVVQHTYAQAGVYTVALRVQDDDSATLATTTAHITVRPPAEMYFSLVTGTTLPGSLRVTNEDIVAFDGSSFSLYFDGSDVGIGSFAIDAFAITSPTEILISFTGAGTAGGVVTDASDILKFTATSLGPDTAGMFAMYFDGSQVGLSTNGENVDAIELHPDGRLLISTNGAASLPEGLSAADEDLLAFTPTSLGTATQGSWSLYFDGSDVELTVSSEDVDAVALDGLGNILLSTRGAFSVSGISGAGEDVFVFTPASLGPTTQGTFAPALFFDGSEHGLAGINLLAIDLD